MSLTAVVNNRESLVIGHMQPIGKETSGAPILGEMIKLIPGLNLVDSKKLEALRKNKAFDAHFTTKIPQSRAPEQNPEKVGQPILVVWAQNLKDDKPFGELPVEKCQEAIEEIFDISMLKKWLATEARDPVRLLLHGQIGKLSTNPNDVVSAGR